MKPARILAMARPEGATDNIRDSPHLERPPSRPGTVGLPRGETMSTSSVARILIVDDDQGNLKALQELLQGLGQKLVLANSGEEALRCVLRDDFAVIVLDVRMPGISGSTLAM